MSEASGIRFRHLCMPIDRRYSRSKQNCSEYRGCRSGRDLHNDPSFPGGGEYEDHAEALQMLARQELFMNRSVESLTRIERALLKIDMERISIRVKAAGALLRTARVHAGENQYCAGRNSPKRRSRTASESRWLVAAIVWAAVRLIGVHSVDSLILRGGRT
jgi:hypothetical protein